MYPSPKHAARVPVRVPFGLQRFRRLSELCRLAPEYLAGRVEFRKELVDERGTRSILQFLSVDDGTITVIVFREYDFNARRMDGF